MEAEEEEEAAVHMFERNLRWNMGMVRYKLRNLCLLHDKTYSRMQIFWNLGMIVVVIYRYPVIYRYS